MIEPDHIYDPDDWEYTMAWQERDQLAQDCEVEHQAIKRFKTLINGPDKFCVLIDNRYEWFDTLDAAQAAFDAAMAADFAGDVGGLGK